MDVSFSRPPFGIHLRMRLLALILIGLQTILSATVTPETAHGQSGFRDDLNSQVGSSIGNEVDFEFFLLADDPLGGSFPGSGVIVNPSTGRVSAFTDFGDLHPFNVGFDRAIDSGVPYSGAMDVVNVAWFGDEEVPEDQEALFTVSQSAEALRVRDWQASGTNPLNASLAYPESFVAPGFAPEFAVRTNRARKNGVGLVYGFRMIERQDGLTFLGLGGILGRAYVNTSAENHIIGPQLGLVWIKSVGRWTGRLHGLASLGFNYGDVSQYSEIGDAPIPGAINRPLFAQPHRSSHSDAHDEFSPNAEIRAEINYRLTNSVTLAANWSGIAIDNALETDGRIRYFLPDMGLVDPGNQQFLVHNFFCGIEVQR
jgi:hypothetical protein